MMCCVVAVQPDNNNPSDVPADDSEANLGGDPACWLANVCPECGVYVDDPTLGVCPKCGGALPPAA
jgi:hypothetical protein